MTDHAKEWLIWCGMVSLFPWNLVVFPVFPFFAWASNHFRGTSLPRAELRGIRSSLPVQ